MKLILGVLSICCTLQLICIQAQDFYYDESGKTYVIDSWGNRRYSGSDPYYIPPKISKPNMKIVDFAMNLFKNVEGGNFVVAPLSPQILLSFLVQQAKGRTKSEILNASYFKNSVKLENLVKDMQNEPTGRKLKIGNAFFIESNGFDKLKPSFFDIYDKPGRPIDVIKTNFFNINQAKNTFNIWVKNKTDNIIKNLDTNFDADTKLVLASTIYFKGQWLFNFNSTQQGDFKLRRNNIINVETMNIRKKFHSGTFDNIEARWVAIPYNSTESMIIIMPNEDETLDNVINQLQGTDISEIIEVIVGGPTMNYVNLTLPKFKLKTSIQLREALEKMNIKELFSSNSQLFLYDDMVPLKIGSALQQSFLEVNEEGSVGASVTSFSAIALSVQPEIKNTDFIVDRPFLAFIIDRKYSVPYFMAKVVDPRE